MFLKKSDPSWQRDDKTVCSILLSPLPGHTFKEAQDLLNQLGAEHVEELSPNFISAEVTKSALPKLQEVAQVEVKHPYQMRQNLTTSE
ncbi:MAG: hypothetical protein ACK58N_17365 [Synechocystis sp.]|jgi:hypothetical protein